MDASLITFGARAPDAALTLNRVALGAFFAISGYLKLFNTARHATLARTLQNDGVRAVPIMRWLVPSVEFSAGCAHHRAAVRARSVRPLRGLSGRLRTRRRQADKRVGAAQFRRLRRRSALPARSALLHRAGGRDAWRAGIVEPYVSGINRYLCDRNRPLNGLAPRPGLL